jgi:hypothetical protein
MKLDEASPFTTLIPQSPADPIVIYNDQAALPRPVACGVGC